MSLYNVNTLSLRGYGIPSRKYNSHHYLGSLSITQEYQIVLLMGFILLAYQFTDDFPACQKVLCRKNCVEISESGEKSAQ